MITRTVKYPILKWHETQKGFLNVSDVRYATSINSFQKPWATNRWGESVWRKDIYIYR